MSKQSWMDEFYPVSAVTIASQTNDEIVLVEHSIRKWKGALPENLKKHNLIAPPFDYSADSCSLCAKFHNHMVCTGCPLYESLEGRCDDEETMDPYHEYTNGGDPLPMIEALEQTLEGLRRRKGEIHVFEDTLSAPPADEEFPY